MNGAQVDDFDPLCMRDLLVDVVLVDSANSIVHLNKIIIIQ